MKKLARLLTTSRRREGEFSEEAAAPEMQTTAFGIDESLLQLKREIENQLLAARHENRRRACFGCISGQRKFVGVGIGYSLPPTTGPAGEIISSDAEPGKQALNVYVVERTRWKKSKPC